MIKLTEEELSAFNRLLGTEWLKARIRGAVLAERRRVDSDKREKEMQK